MTLARTKCAQCGKTIRRERGQINRASRTGRVFCNLKCFGLSRRVERPEDERKALKAAYDRQRRALLGEELRAQKREAYAKWGPANRDVEKARRDANKDRHAEYIRSPRYRAWKKDYDQRRADGEFAEFGDARRALLQLEREIRKQATRYEIYVARGYYNKKQNRRRQYEAQQSTSL